MRLLTTGFEQNTLTVGHEIDTSVGSGILTIQGTTKRTGGYALKMLADGVNYRGLMTQLPAIATGRTFYFKYSFLLHTALNILDWPFTFTNSGVTYQVGIGLDTDNVIWIADNNGASVSGAPLTLDTWNTIEFSYVYATGLLTLRLNGVVVGTLAGTASQALDRIYYSGSQFISGYVATGEWYMDDIIVNDDQGSAENTWPGDQKVIYLPVSAAGDFNSFLVKAGTEGTVNNYQNVGEIPPNDATDYNKANGYQEWSAAGTYSWVAPFSGTVRFEVWGGGGGGGGVASAQGCGGGGAGGQYARKDYSVVAGNTYSIVVAAAVAAQAGDGLAGNDSYVQYSAVDIARAKGGAQGLSKANGGTGGTGSAASGVGDQIYQGGNGSAGKETTPWQPSGGGGGGAGNTGAGGNSTAGSAGGAGSGYGGGAGNAGKTSSGAGAAGSQAGGGGSGACRTTSGTANGGAGTLGRARIIYTGYTDQQDLMNCADSGLTGNNTINCVQVGMRFSASASSAVAAFKLMLEIAAGGTKALSAAITPNSTSFKTNANAAPRTTPITLYLDPDGNAFSVAKLDAMQIGYIITTVNTALAYLSAVWAYVSYIHLPYDVAVGISEAGSGSEAIDATPVIGIQETGAFSEAWDIFRDDNYESVVVTDLGGGATPIAISDSGSGSDAVSAILNLLPILETAVGTETLNVLASFILSEVGSGSDAVQAIYLLTNITDSGNGSDLASILTLLSQSDSGSGTEILTVLALLGISETGTAIEVLNILNTLSVNDTAAGTDNASLLAILANIADSGTASEVLSILSLLTTADSGAGSDSVVRTALVALFETGSGADLISLLNLFTISDTGAGADVVSVDFGATPISISDSGSGTDAISAFLNMLGVSDLGSATEALSILNQLNISDTATSAEVLSAVRLLSIPETGSASEAITILNLLNLPDSASGADVITILALFTLTDSATGADIVGILNKLPISDAGTLTDALSVLILISISETGAGVDAATILDILGISDTGHGTDSVSAFLGFIGITDLGSASESLNILNQFSVSDSGAAVDAVSSLILLSILETGSATDAVGIAKIFGIEDSGLATELLNVMSLLGIAENGTASEVIYILKQFNISDSAVGEEAIEILRNLALTDSGVGADTINIAQIILKSIADAGAAVDEVLRALVTLILRRSNPFTHKSDYIRKKGETDLQGKFTRRQNPYNLRR